MKRESIIIYILGFVLLIIGIFYDKQIISFLVANRISYMNFISWFSFLGKWFVVLIFMTFLFILQKKKRKLIFPLWLSLIGSMLITYALKIIIIRARPEQALTLVSSISSSFPSGHATAVFSVFAILGGGKEFPKFKWWWLVFACLIVFSRLYLGMHYLTDVVVGGLIGYTVGLLVVRYARLRGLKIKNNKK